MHFLKNRWHFLIRLRLSKANCRKLLDANKRKRTAHSLANNLELPHRYRDFYPHCATELLFNWTTVRLPDRPDETLTLIVFLDLKKSPVALLTNEKQKSPKKIARLISYYLARYPGCEDPVRFFKQEFKIEKFRIETLPAIRKWFFWIAVAFSMLFDIQTAEEILRCVINFSKPFLVKVRFPYYRILRGINYLLRNALPYGSKIHRHFY